MYSNPFKLFTVYMKDNKGNVWAEDAYGGYGKFGGKDFYELAAEMNGLSTRDEGILLSRSITTDESFKHRIENRSKIGLMREDLTVEADILIQKRKNAIFPNLVENINTEWKNEEPKTCEYQGFFYPIEDGEEVS